MSVSAIYFPDFLLNLIVSGTLAEDGGNIIDGNKASALFPWRLLTLDEFIWGFYPKRHNDELPRITYKLISFIESAALLHVLHLEAVRGLMFRVIRVDSFFMMLAEVCLCFRLGNTAGSSWKLIVESVTVQPVAALLSLSATFVSAVRDSMMSLCFYQFKCQEINRQTNQ